MVSVLMELNHAFKQNVSSKVHHQIAIELGFSEKIVERALKKYKFKSAGDFVHYLELNEDEFAETDEVVQKAKPEEEKMAVAAFPEKEKTENTQNAAVKADKSLREETEDLYRRSICLNCFNRRRSIVILPCSHFALCEQCLKQVKKCPVSDCCEEIECTIVTYF